MVVVPTADEIENAASEQGVVRYAMGLPNARTLARNEDFVVAVSRLVSSGRARLQGSADHSYLAAMNRGAFFGGIRLLCEVIPLLDVEHRELMAVVVMLVECGGNDLAANEPYSAFRQWCTVDDRRVDTVLKDARAAKGHAVRLLSFALEAGERVDEAIDFLAGESPEAVAGAALAVSRMELDSSDANRCVSAIADVFHTDDDTVLQQAVLACFQILAKHEGLCRSEAHVVLGHAVKHGGDRTRYALATLLAQHGSTMTDEEIDQALFALRKVDGKLGGTVEEIDMAARWLVARGHFDGLMKIVSNLIRGGARFDSLVRVWEELIRGDASRLKTQAARWLMEGHPRVCLELARRLGRYYEQPWRLDLPPETLPNGAAEQLFLCRKAVGFLFVAPITAASVLVSVLKDGHAALAEDVGALLHEVLLVNYSGDLRAYLEEVAGEHEAVERVVADSLEKTAASGNEEGLMPLPEMQPAEQRRQVAHAHEVRTMADAIREGSSKSVFAGLFREDHLGYGTSVSMYTAGQSDGDPKWQRVEVPMQSHSVSAELPRLSALDPEGLEQLLWRLRTEKRVTQ